jgi:hypothetical protein
MSYLKVNVVKQSCIFILRVEGPVDSLRRLAHFFKDNRIVLNDFNLHANEDGTAIVIAHSVVEKQLLQDAVWQLHQLPGILKVEVMQKYN